MKNFMKTHKWVKVGVIFLCVIFILLLVAVLFLKLCPAFGGKASAEDRKDYESRAENYRDGKFYNDGDFQIVRDTEQKDEHIMSSKGTKPEMELPVKIPSYDGELQEDEVRVTWFGHSSLLLQMHGLNILIDPVFCERSSPVSFVGNKRFSHSPVEAGDLPHIDLLVLSHDHYDHLDYNVIKEIDEKVDSYIVPIGVENHLERWGVEKKKIQNMAWWEETTVNGLTIGCTPAIHDKYGDFDFIMTDCAQYDVNWPEVHMFPEAAVQAAQTLGAKVTMPIHWGAFTLANHAWDDSAERFVAAGEQAGLQIVTPQIGETMKLGSLENYMERWWKEIQ